MNYCHSATPLKEQTNILAWPRWMFLGIQKSKVTVMTMKKWNELMSFFENPIHKIFLPANLVSGTFYRLFWIPSTTYRKDRRGKLSVLWVLLVLCVSTSDSSVHYISFHLSTPAIQKSNTGTGYGKGVSIDNHHCRKKTISRKAKLI